MLCERNQTNDSICVVLELAKWNYGSNRMVQFLKNLELWWEHEMEKSLWKIVQQFLVSYKIKLTLPNTPWQSSPCYSSKWNKAFSYTKSCTRMFRVVLFIMTPNWKQLVSFNWGMDKQTVTYWYNGYNSEIKKNTLPITHNNRGQVHVLHVNERNCTQKVTCILYDSIYVTF